MEGMMDIDNDELDDETVKGDEAPEGAEQEEEPVPIEERVAKVERELNFTKRENDDLRRRLARAESLAKPGGVGKIPRRAAESEDEEGAPEDIDNRRRLEEEPPSESLSGEELKRAIAADFFENFPDVAKHPMGERVTKLAMSELQRAGRVVIGETDPFLIVERVGKLATSMLKEYDGRAGTPSAGKKNDANNARRKDVAGARASNTGPARPKSKDNEDEDLLSRIPRL
jgi:hypothetical protein